jgi:hypothetical protein
MFTFACLICTTMFKFLLYLFLFYFLFRFVFGTLFKGIIRAKVININHHHYHDKSEEEGKVKVDHSTIKDIKHNDKSLGEYVDYEEVK